MLESLTFLSPLAGVIAGALGGAGVLVSYFLKLRRRPVRVASTLLWEQAVQDLQVNAPLRWLRASWPLLLQLLVVALCALALSRPAIDAPGLGADRIILILDASASMSAEDAPDSLTRLEEAKRRAQARVRRLPGEARVMVIAAGADARTVLNFSRDRGQLDRAIGSIAPTDQPGDLRAALRVAEAFASGAGETTQEDPPALWIFTDGNAVTGPGENALDLRAPVGAVVVERVGPPSEVAKDNLGIAAVRGRRDFDNPAVVRTFVRIVSARDQPTPVGLTLTIDGEEAETRAVEIPPRTEESVGEVAQTFEFRRAGGGTIVITLSRDDDLSADDAAAVVLPAPRLPRVLVVQPGETVQSDFDALLIDALAATFPEGQEQVERMSIEEYARRAEAGASFVSAYSLVVFDRHRPEALPPVPTISFGATLPIPGLAVRDGDATGTRFAVWSRTHPVMRNLSLNNVAIRDPGVVALPGDTARVGGDPISSETIARGVEGPLIATVTHGGVRRVVLGFDLNRTNWPPDASFPLFISNAVEYLTLGSDRVGSRAFSTTEPVFVLLDAPADATARLTGPDDIERTATTDGAGRADFGVIPRAGLYTASAGEDRQAVAVNLFSDAESSITTRDELQVGGRAAARIGAGDAGPREVWHWFIAAAVVLLAVEWVLYARRMRA